MSRAQFSPVSVDEAVSEGLVVLTSLVEVGGDDAAAADGEDPEAAIRARVVLWRELWGELGGQRRRPPWLVGRLMLARTDQVVQRAEQVQQQSGRWPKWVAGPPAVVWVRAYPTPTPGQVQLEIQQGQRTMARAARQVEAVDPDRLTEVLASIGYTVHSRWTCDGGPRAEWTAAVGPHDPAPCRAPSDDVLEGLVSAAAAGWAGQIALTHRQHRPGHPVDPGRDASEVLVSMWRSHQLHLARRLWAELVDQVQQVAASTGICPVEEAELLCGLRLGLPVDVDGLRFAEALRGRQGLDASGQDSPGGVIRVLLPCVRA